MNELEAINVLAASAGGKGTSLAVVAASITIAIVLIAVTLPKILNSIRADKMSGNVLSRLQKLEDKAAAQDEKIHRHAVRITKLSMLLLQFHGLLVTNNVPIHQWMVDEMVELTREIKDDE